MDRSYRRRLKKELRTNYNDLNKHGLPTNSSEGHILTLTLYIRDTILKAKNRNSIFSIFDAGHNTASEHFELSCKKGCSYCCHQFVSASGFEIDRIVSFVNQNFSEDEITSLKSRLDNNKNINLEKRVVTQEPCSFLDGNSCKIYEVRPFACRRFISIDLEKCIESFDLANKEDNDFPYIQSVVMHATSFRIALYAAMQLENQFPNSFELLGAVDFALNSEKFLSDLDSQEISELDLLMDEADFSKHALVKAILSKLR